MSLRDIEAGELGDPSTADYPTGIFIFCPRGWHLQCQKKNLLPIDHLIHLDYRWRWRGAQDELARWGAHGRPHHGGVETGFQVNFKRTWSHKVNTQLHWTKFWQRGQSSGGHCYPQTKVAIIFWLLTCFRCIPPIRSCQSWPCCQGCRRSISCIAQTNVKLH